MPLEVCGRRIFHKLDSDSGLPCIVEYNTQRGFGVRGQIDQSCGQKEREQSGKVETEERKKRGSYA